MPPTPARGRPILLLDRDCARHAAAIRRFNAAGWTVVVMSHQPGEWGAEAEGLKAALLAELAAQHACVDGVYPVPLHSPAGQPPDAVFQHALDAQAHPPTNCVAVGDKLAHLVPARRIGCRTVLVETGHGAALAAYPLALPFQPDAILPDLEAVADWVLKESANL